MLDIGVDLHPLMLARFPYRMARRREIGIAEQPDRDCNRIGDWAALVPHGRAASRTEMVMREVPRIGGANPLGAVAGDRDLVLGPPRLLAKRRPAALLAGKAMADRDADRLAFARGGERAATAGGGAGGHLRGQ